MTRSSSRRDPHPRLSQPRSSREGPWQSLVRATSWHRRKLAAVAAALAVLTGVSAALPEDPPTVPVVVAAGQLRGGTVVTLDQVEVRRVRAEDAAEGSVSEPSALVGRTLAAPVAAGQMLTELALVAPRAARRPGRVVAPLRLGDAGLVALLRPGDVVDVIGADNQAATARVVAAGVRVVTVPEVDEGSAAEASGALVLVEVTSGTATDLAQAAAAGTLTVSWR